MRSRFRSIPILAFAIVLFATAFGWAVETAEAETDPKLLAEYDERASHVRDAEGHVKLALWCERKGLVPERQKQLVLAALGSNATARGLLGQVADGERFHRPETIAQRALADNRLTTKLAEYEARRARLPKPPKTSGSLVFGAIKTVSTPSRRLTSARR